MKYTKDNVLNVLKLKKTSPELTSKEIGNLLNLPDYFVRRTCNTNNLYFGHYTPFKSKELINISVEAHSLIVGSLLGDGYISKYKIDSNTSTNKNSRFEIKHGLVQKEYALFKSKLLKSFGLDITVSYVDKKEPHKHYNNLILNNGSIIVSSPQNKVFNAYRDLWYPEGIKVIPLNIEISPLSLAIWAMDDGSNSKSGGFYFHSQGFTLASNERLIKYLNEKYNLFCKIHYIRGMPVIYVKRKSKKLLFSVIDKFICKSMQYKFIY